MTSETQKPPRRYEKMRDSGVEWIGMVPEHWQVQKAKRFVVITNGSDPKTEGNIPVYGSGVTSFKTCGEYKIGPAVLVGRKGSINNPRYVDGLFWNVDTAFDVKSKNESAFLTKYYFYLSVCFDYNYYSSQTTLPSMTQESYNNMFLPYPPVSVQQCLVDYLGEKCNQIDQIVADIKASIEEYKAWKASIIYEAVTKGLDPHAEMKDSGVKWIGKIASNFSVIRLKYLMHDYKAGPFGSSLITDKLNRTGDILVYTPEHIARQSTKTEHDLFLPPDRLSKMSPFLVTTGDIIFPIVGSLGRAMVVTSNMPKGIINQRLAKFSPNKEIVDTNYFMWLFGRSDFYSQYIETRCRGSIIVNLTKSIVSDMPVVLPPDLQTQRRIAKYLQEKSGIIDSLVKEKEALISDLETYKKSLIYEVVTGKREVV